MATEFKWFNEFDAKFKELERRAANDPSRIDWLVMNSPEVRRLVGALYYRDARFKNRMQNRLFLADVPPWFLERYRAYCVKFGPAVERVYMGLLIDVVLEGKEEVDGIPAEEILHPEGKPAREESEDTEVVSLLGGLEELEFVFHWVANMADGSEREEDLIRGVAAWEYLTETIGLDVTGVALRWHKLPRALVPLRAHESVESVLGLLEEAAKAYVFGLPAAAMAMCRATCEIVLKQFYDDGYENSLDKIIFMAEKKFQHLKGLDLRKHVSAANRIMHNHGKSGRLSDAEDESARQFLETVKTLIERAPSSQAPKPV